MAPEPVVRLEACSKVFPGGTVGLDAVDLDIASGEFLSLVGPSGCGKTTSLRLIAGFEQPTTGRILLDSRDVTPLEPYDRPVNTVFQDYALFPHMDVGQNVGFGLSLRRMSLAEVRRKVHSALDLVGLAEKFGSPVSALSGGQRQRVALARAIVCEPRVLLLDEPLSALDAHLREQMQIELKRLQSQLGTTFVMVTHDQTEALSISDRIAVMNKGRIEQIASPSVLYDAPATRFVASFIGTTNLIEATVLGHSEGRATLAAGELRFEAAAEGTPADGSKVTAAIRPEDIVVVPQEAGEGGARLTGTVFHGRMLRLHLALDEGTALVVDMARQGATLDLAPGARLAVAVRPGAARILP